mmetsp:Transcript_19118/g.26300  ORF Transcript_19118/g.26300 Transcript_19118/m.26300 type:complete len:236 (-) Transcript_19118:2629-3336(-)
MNGDIRCRQDILRLQDLLDNGEHNQATKEKSRNYGFMISRAALWDPSVFQQLKPATNEKVPLMQLLSKIVVLSARTANCPANTRYLLQNILAGHRMLQSCSTLRSSIQNAKDLCALAEIVQCSEEVEAARLLQQSNIASTNNLKLNINAGKRRRVNQHRWPGLVAYSSHSYSDKYFDDNYYTAFQRPDEVHFSVESSSSNNLSEEVVSKKSNEKKKTFSFAGFSDADTVVTRIKR